MKILQRVGDPLTWISFLFHLLLLGVPFVFTWVNEELFEFPKMLAVYLLAVLIVAAWIWRMVAEKKLRVAKTALDIPILLFLFSQILSTVFSIHPRTSILGYYTRFNGGLLSTIAYISLFYAFVSNFEKKHLVGFLKTALLGGFLSTLYAIPEHFGRSPSCLLITGQFDVSCWVQDVQTRVFSSFGQPNWLAAYLITLIPLTLVRFTNRSNQWWFRALGILMVVALLYTKSRSGVLGLGVGLGSMLLLQVIFNRQSQKNIWLGGLLVGAIFLLMGSPFNPSISQLLSREKTATVQPAAPSGTVLDTGGTDSGVIRQIVWKGALQVWRRYPLFGSGVETFAYSYYQDRPTEHNTVSEWDFLYNKAHNEFLNYLATTGIVGAFSYTLLLCWFGFLCIALIRFESHSDEERQLALALLAGIIALSVSNFFGFSTVMVTVLLFWFMAVISILAKPTSANQATGEIPPQLHFDLGHWLAALAICVFVAVLTFQVYQQWWADRLFVRAKSLFQAGDYSLALDHFSAAITASPGEALYYDELAMDYGKLAAELDQTNETTAAAQLAQTAIKASDYALQLNPRHLNFYKTRARVFINLSQINPTYLPKAIETLEKAIVLSPTDAKLYYNLALIQLASDDFEQGIKTLQKSIELKPDYITARYELGKQWEAHGEPAKATTEYEYILTHLSPNNPEVTARLQAIASMSAKLRNE